MNTQHTPELRDAFETAANNFGYGALQKHDDGRYLWAPTYHAWNGFQLGVKHAEQQRDELLKSASAILTRIDNSISGHYAINFGACSDEVADLRKAIAKAGES